MSYLQAREQLRQAADLIKNGDMKGARDILRPLCEGGSADAWWLLAQTTQNPEQIRIALEKALEINPQHGRASEQYARLFPNEPLPEAALPPERKPKEKEKVSPRRAHGMRLIVTAIGGLVVGLSIFVLFRSLTYTLPPPVLGPYYQRHRYTYIEQAPAPCDQFLVFGQVKNAPPLIAHLWVGEYDQQIPTDAQGNFQFTLPKEAITYTRNPKSHYLGDVPVKLQLQDASSGAGQSGINHLWFLSGCAIYVEYWHENTGGLKFGNQTLRPPSWNGPYDVSYSELTTTPLLICDFTGFTGTAYDDNGPMHDLVIQIVNLDEQTEKPHYYVANTQGLEVQMGPSWWYIFAEPDHRYSIQVVNPLGTIIFTDVVYLPKKQGCEANLIKVSIMQLENRTGTPPPLPAGWGKS